MNWSGCIFDHSSFFPVFFFFCLHLRVWLQISANRSRDAGSYSCGDGSRPSLWDGPAQQTKPKYIMNSVVLLVADKHKLHIHLPPHEAEFTPPWTQLPGHISSSDSYAAAEGGLMSEVMQLQPKVQVRKKALALISSCKVFFFFLLCDARRTLKDSNIHIYNTQQRQHWHCLSRISGAGQMVKALTSEACSQFVCINAQWTGDNSKVVFYITHKASV